MEDTNRITGTVASVQLRPVGAALVADAAASTRTLVLDDNSNIAPGDRLRLTDVDPDNTGAPIGEDDTPVPAPTEVVTVASTVGTQGVNLAGAGTSRAYPTGSVVAPDPGEIEVIAQVRLADDKDPLPIPVERALAVTLRVGLRTDGTGELVRVARVAGELRVVDVLGLGPGVEGEFVDVNGALPDLLQDIYDEANELAAAAAEAAYTATVAQETADGKNKVTYANIAPGSTPNSPGDLWFVRDGTPTAGIVSQWEGQGGNAWVERKLRSEVIANLDAGKITAGTAFINALQVLTNFTLGNSTINGVIQSFDFANQPVGVLISKNGLVAKGGSIAGATITGGNVYGTNIEGGTFQAGVIQGNVSVTIGGSGSFVCFGDAVFASGTPTLFSHGLTANGSIVSTASVRGYDLYSTNPANGGTGFVNCNIGPDGRIVRDTSSIRYKENVTPLALSEARKVLDLEVVTFTRKDDETGIVYPGVIAEQAETVGLDLWVNRDADGQVDGFRYNELAVAHNVIIRDQQERIANLEADLADLAARLEALEGTP